MLMYENDPGQLWEETRSHNRICWFLVVQFPLLVAAESTDCGAVTDTMDTFDLELLCVFVNNLMIFNEHYLPTLVDAGNTESPSHEA